MRIGFDGKRAVKNFTGIGNYSRLVIEQLAKAHPENEYFVYTPKLKDNPRLANIQKLPNVSFHLPPPQGFKGSLWRSYGITNHLGADKVDIYHGLSNELPLNIKGRGVKSIVTIHDLIFLTYPQGYKPLDRYIYNYKFKRSVANADHVVAISECTKNDIIKYYNTDPEKITTIYQGCDDIFRQPLASDEIEKVKDKYGLTQQYIIQVGTIEKRKNLELTVRALSALPPEITLTVVGRDHLGYKKRVMKIADQLGVSARIHWLENVPFIDLPALYSGAIAAAYPSRYEGFGIPVLEALECNTPVVAATGSCLEEAGGPASIYVNPDEPRQMANALSSIINDPSIRQRIVYEGKTHAARFSTNDMADRLHNLYEKISKK